MGGIATRNFNNFRQPEATGADYGGSRSIIEGRYKWLLQDRKGGETRRELFDLEEDPGETKNLAGEKPEVAESLDGKLREWQDSVLKSLRGSDYGE